MKRYLAYCFAAIAAVSITAQAATISYITDSSEPWGQAGGVNGMNQVFGAGNWTRLTFANALASDAYGYDALYLDGGAANTAGFQNFINANRAGLESYVANGGSLFLNAARWGGLNGFDLGFGVRLNNGGSSVAHITPGQAGNAIFAGTNSNWVGSSFSHDYLTGAGLTALINDGAERAILAELSYGSGRVLFGGLTLAFFGQHGGWSADTGLLRNNILLSVGNAANPLVNDVPEPASAGLLGIALLGLYLVRRRATR